MGAPALVKFSIVAMSKEVAPFYPVTLLKTTGMMRSVTSVVDATFKNSYIFIYIYYNMSLLLLYSVFMWFSGLR